MKSQEGFLPTEGCFNVADSKGDKTEERLGDDKLKLLKEVELINKALKELLEEKEEFKRTYYRKMTKTRESCFSNGLFALIELDILMAALFGNNSVI